jgi:exodeoxyribonuclease V alpha subunit
MQKMASISAVLKRFCVISGGPGTGKTTTVVKILALLVEQAGENDIKIILCAPTGKAAASLSETIRSAKMTIDCDDAVKNAIPDDASTIHRLLKTIPGSPYFRHNKDNPIHADVVIIDEASMIDVALMAKLFNSIPKEARIILVGDKDQLSSVEAGSVLGDICNRENVFNISQSTIEEIQQFLTGKQIDLPNLSKIKKGLQEHIIVLDRNYRFDEKSGIGGFSESINKGDSETGLRMLMDSNEKGIDLKEVNDRITLYQELKKEVMGRYSEYLKEDNPYNALKLFNQFKVLCALRTGPFGVGTINQIIQNILYENGLIDVSTQEPDSMYNGRPILITRNDYSSGLFNGDTGIILSEHQERNESLQAFFPINKNETRQVPLHRLPQHETAYAMTVHKSQGSEFNDVVLILPDKHYPILTRELIYTGVTRTVHTVTIWGNKDVFKEAIRRKIERTSGLRDALWGD